MKNNIRMRKAIYGVALCVVAMLGVSCTEKPKSDNIIVHKQPKTAKPATTQAMSDYTSSCNIDWLGATYKVSVERKADKQLPHTVDEQGNKYYDNRISVRIQRGDGSVFFERVFQKSDFTPYISEAFAKGALLGVVFDKVDGESLRFAASVGSPDRMSDEYEPLVVKVSRLGAVSIAKDTRLDTTSDEQSQDEDEEEGV